MCRKREGWRERECARVCIKLKSSFICAGEPGIMPERVLLYTDVTIANGE
jgi:hypothetical protein